MASLPNCFDDAPLAAADVARGVARLFWRQDLVGICEVPLGNGRRADIMAIDAKGCITIVEIKCSRADLRGTVNALIKSGSMSLDDSGALVPMMGSAALSYAAPTRSSC